MTSPYPGSGDGGEPRDPNETQLGGYGPPPHMSYGHEAAGYGDPAYVQPQYPPQGYAPPGYPQQPGYGQPPYQPYPAPYAYGYPTTPGTNGMAIASMVLGILWLYWVGSILALIFGYIARNQIRERGQGGDGMAIAGIVLGWIGVATLVLVIVIAVAVSGHH